MEEIRTFPEPLRDQWQVQLQLMAQLKAEIGVYSEGLTAQQLQECLLHAVTDLEAELERLVGGIGTDASICVLPQGPLTIPYIKE